MNRLFPLRSLVRLLLPSTATPAATIHTVHSRQCWRSASPREKLALVAGAVATAIVVAAVPAWRLTRVTIAEALRAE